jgi:hypothetical protein
MSNIFVQQCTVKTLRKDISDLQKSRRSARFQAAHDNAANMVLRKDCCKPCVHQLCEVIAAILPARPNPIVMDDWYWCDALSVPHSDDSRFLA